MQLQIFKYQSEEEQLFNEIRTIEQEDGSVLFGATDVARVLGYANPQKAVREHCREEGVNEIDTPTENQWGKVVNQKVKYITEGNVYRLIVRSKLPNAEKFEKWLFDEVVPQSANVGSMGELTEQHYRTSLKGTKRTTTNSQEIISRSYRRCMHVYIWNLKRLDM